MKDLFDGDTTPTVRTLLVDRSLETVIGDADETANFPDEISEIDPSNETYRDYPGRASGPLFDPEIEKAVGSDPPEIPTGHEEHRKAVNVFGIEPMPVLTEVTSFYVFQDVSEDAGGDKDYRDLRPRVVSGLPTLIPRPGSMPRITIDGTPDPVANPDALMEGIAFQLHNPWDTTISLGGERIKNADENLTEGDPLTRHRFDDDADVIDTETNSQFEYYIEWNGYFFKLAQYQQYYPPSSNGLGSLFRERDEGIVGATNPTDDFGLPIDGSGTPPNDNGGHLVPADYPDFVGRNVTLGPGQTRVFYAIADPRFDPASAELVLDRKWRDAFKGYDDVPTRFSDVSTDTDGNGIPDFDLDEDTLADGGDGRGWTGLAAEWLTSQFDGGSGNMARAVMVQPMNPQTGSYLSEEPRDLLETPLTHGSPVDTITDESEDLDQLSGATGRIDANEVRLWRKIVTPGEEETTADNDAFDNPEPRNLLHNDLLVDRLSFDIGPAIPLDPDLDVDQTAGFPEDYPATSAEEDADVRNDNTGYTIVKWSTYGSPRLPRRARPGRGAGPGVGALVSAQSLWTASWTRTIRSRPIHRTRTSWETGTSTMSPFRARSRATARRTGRRSSSMPRRSGTMTGCWSPRACRRTSRAISTRSSRTTASVRP